MAAGGKGAATTAQGRLQSDAQCRAGFSGELSPTGKVWRLRPAWLRIRFSVNHRLTVTPIAREKGGYRLRLLVSEIERPGNQRDGMNMVVAAALMLDGLPFEMLVDARGFLQGGGRLARFATYPAGGAPTPCRAAIAFRSVGLQRRR